jgi:hypothetical protein
MQSRLSQKLIFHFFLSGWATNISFVSF